MMHSFLMTIGLCVLSQTAEVQAMQRVDILPCEDSVQIIHLPNGVKTYVQEHASPSASGSFRVVLRKPGSKEELYRYDGTLESMDSIEEFFQYCKDRASINPVQESVIFIDELDFLSSDLPSSGNFLPQEVAVIAVGDFNPQQMQMLIEKHFDGLTLKKDAILSTDSIQIGVDPGISKVALTFSYPNERKAVQTYSDLKEVWKTLLLQDLFQQRLERCARLIEEVWVHPHPRFFYPVNGYSLVPQEHSENLLTFFLWQVEAIRKGGYYEDEFHLAKRNLLRRLQYLASSAAVPDDAFLASYYADQFLLGEQCPTPQSFLDASVKLVEELQMNDLAPHIDSFLLEKNRTIQVTYPMSLHVELLTRDHIEQMIQRIASLATFYSESDIPEEEVWRVETQNKLNSRGSLIQENSLPLQLIHQGEPGVFQLAKNPEISADDTTDITEPFFKLPITEKEKRLIKIIVTTMAEKNILQLAFVKRTIEKKGKKIERVHPMRFMGYILSSSELRSCLRSIKKSSFKWDAFIDGFSRRMREEYANDNLFIHIPGFAQQIGAKPEEVTRFIQRKDWEGLVKEFM